MRAFCVALGVLTTVTLAACGVGAGGSQDGSATLTVTRDFGAQRLFLARQDPIPEGETVLRFLTRKAKDVETRYGGRFVNAIDGVRSQAGGGERRDWFYFVNGIEADTGAAERKVEGGDRIWWDYRDWSAAMRVPAVVGSFPEPFVHGSEGKRFPVRLDCAPDTGDQCDAVRNRLDSAGVETAIAGLGTATGKDTLRVVVGVWKDARLDAAAEKLEEGPGESGVFARPAKQGDGYRFDVLDAKGRTVRSLGAGAGIVAATRFEEQQPTWVVSGTDAAGLDRAIELVDRAVLRDRFAVATDGAQPIPLPTGSRGGE